MHKTLSCSLFLAIAASVLFACGGPAGGAAPATPEAPKTPGAAAAPGAGPKAIPHSIVGKEDCTSCHKAGGAKGALPADHEGRTSATCTGCHQAAAK